MKKTCVINRSEKPLNCPKCDNKFTRFEYNHSNEKPFKCSKCKKTFTRSEVLKRQVNKKQSTNDKPFSCSKCDKTFTNSVELTIHDETHSSEKPFKCLLCDEKFATASDMKSHEKGHQEEPVAKNQEKNFQVISWNIDKGLLKKLAEINHVLSEENVGICFLIEVEDTQENLNSLNSTNPKAFPNYSIHTSKSLSPKTKVRIIALVHEDISFKIREDLMSHNVASIWMEVSRKFHKNLIIGGIYRQWNVDEEKDSDAILTQISRASEENLPLLVCGDVNLDMLKWSKRDYYRKKIADKWKSSITKAGLKWPSLGITYISNSAKNGEHSKSALDHFYYSSDKSIFKVQETK